MDVVHSTVRETEPGSGPGHDDPRLADLARLAAHALAASAAAVWIAGRGWAAVTGAPEARLAPVVPLVRETLRDGAARMGEAGAWGFAAVEPVLSAAGVPAGALCVLDARPRRLGARRRAVLASLARLAADLAPARRATRPDVEAATMRARFEALFENTEASVFIKDRRGALIAANAKYLRMAGVGDVVGRTDRELYGPEIGDALRARDAAIFASGEPFTGEERVVFPSGEEVIYLSNKLLIYDAALDDLVLCGIATDITAQKRLQASLEESRRRAEEADRAKAQFLAAVSHEIRTPMNGVLGMLALLSGTPLDDRQRAMAQVARDSAADLLAILNDIIDYARVETHDFDFAAQPFDLRGALRRAIAPMRPRARRKGLALTLVVNRAAPRRVVGDGARIRQVLGNLVANAVKFTDEGSIRVECAPCAGGLRIAVVDTGVGVALDQQARIFAGFAQGDGSSTRRFGGLGLGLAIGKRLIEGMGGRIGVDSEEGQGATFWFTLPLAAAPDA